MRRLLLDTVVFTIGSALYVLPAVAEQCDPRNFAFAAYEELRYNYSLYINALSIMDERSAQQSSKDYSLGAVIPDAGPINITGKEASAVSNSVLRVNKKQVDENKAVNYVRTSYRFEGD